ncbi:hypothetical protein ACFOLM_00005, partial [Deinococcus soli (ex Cha et al. 2016)]|uniref:hypothetical protein n=1 Tax=Deinococcus soli (ex Cha et al. 2016) TaxID=1309411 RepID=UPI003622D170
MNAQPRPVTVLSTRNATYEAPWGRRTETAGPAESTGDPHPPDPRRLDGNGTQEVIIEARHFQNGRDDFPPP